MYDNNAKATLEDLTKDTPLTPFKKKCLICIQTIQAAVSVLSIAFFFPVTLFVSNVILQSKPDHSLIIRVVAVAMCTAIFATLALTSMHFFLLSIAHIKALSKENSDEASTPLLSRHPVETV